MGEGDKKSPLNYTVVAFGKATYVTHFSSPLALKRVWVSNCDIMQVWRRLLAHAHGQKKLRPRPADDRSDASLGARGRGLPRAAWVGGATHPLPSLRAGKRANRQVKTFASCPSVLYVQTPEAERYSFVSFSQPSPNASHKLSF
jgi:hypothetical protein